jgi:alcohol dehydrogenase (cytochrome c)
LPNRSGPCDNIFTAASVLAISPSDGKIKWGYQYTPNDPYDYDEISEHPIINAKVNGEDRKLVVHGARNGFFCALDRTNGSFIAGKQYVDQLNWTPGLDPKTGKPLNYDSNADVQIYAPGSHGTRARPLSEKLCPSVSGGKNWQPGAYNPQLGLIYIPSIEGCSSIQTTEQKDRDDQSGTVKPRDRFIGGAFMPPAPRLYGALKAVDPVTGETKVNQRLDYANYAGAMATAGNLVFLGHIDGTFSAYDAKTLKELWSFNVGTGINAPPITYAVNGKQYVAVLVGSRQPNNVIPQAPELKNTATTSRSERSALTSEFAGIRVRAASTTSFSSGAAGTRGTLVCDTATTCPISSFNAARRTRASLLEWLGVILLPRSSKMRPIRMAGESVRRTRRARALSASFAWTASKVARSMIGSCSPAWLSPR